MSLAIDIDRVVEVLLPDGAWQQVSDSSFVIDAYEYVEAKQTTFKGDEAKEVIPAAGASWTEPSGAAMFCPLTSVRAVRYAAAAPAAAITRGARERLQEDTGAIP